MREAISEETRRHVSGVMPRVPEETPRQCKGEIQGEAGCRAGVVNNV